MTLNPRVAAINACLLVLEQGRALPAALAQVSDALKLLPRVGLWHIAILSAVSSRC